MICPYCNEEAVWCENKEVYGKNYGRSYVIYLCKQCDARVGCHNNTKEPLGTMANKELREWRMKVHTFIDLLWKSNKMKRQTVYRRLNEFFKKEIHVGSSDIELCKQIIENFNLIF